MFEITGEVYEKNEKIPLEFSTVILKPLRGKRVFGGMTDDKGKFLVKEFVDAMIKKQNLERIMQ